MKEIDILLVEDNEGDIVLTMEAMKQGKLKNNVIIARDGQMALDMLLKNAPYQDQITPDLILLDINLPKMDGIEVLKQIKENKLLKRIPVIMLTTSAEEGDILKSYNNYANCYITKPINLSSFMEVVSTIEEFWVSLVQLPSKR
ncbi:response regulator [Mucilaginibacter sp. KACC 22063]|uniref:response regulator n=1 Tax=Mucilaginibacter sp. KACC 22063 TaxID=3025666 RepID=UPI0023660C76|nr:response regulator [Mucilaginibacter sp. KACC 22063]WDF56726.1 response regulator [Mucilaginibacter sp. KACC 22063]